MKSIFWLGILVLFANPCFAQSSNIISDDSLGNEASQVEKNSQLQGLPVEIIRGGAQRGINLFHSFREFNVSEGRGAYFFSPNAEVQNILTRVTGSNRSEILGTLGTFGNSQPNLFLINPNGILFGENSSLDLEGSFVGTTANGVQFGEQGVFSATNPEAPALLTVNPSAFFFNQIQPGKIENRSIAALGNDFFGLRVPDGHSLLLVGGDITVDGGGLYALGGELELAGFAGNGRVGLNFDGSKNLSLNVPDTIARADISLINNARLDVVAGGGGSITINARNLEVKDRSYIFAGISSGLGTPESQTGNITINTTSSAKFDGEFPTGIFNQIQSGAEGKAGDIFINTGSLEVYNGALISSTSSGKGNASSITINATDSIKLDGEDKNGTISSVLSIVESVGEGKAGNVLINTTSLEVTNGAHIRTSTRGKGDAGSVIINATDSIKFDGEAKNGIPSRIIAFVEGGGEGNAGDILINTNSLKVTNGARFAASTRGKGDAGSVIINATDSIKFDGETKNGTSSGARSAVEAGADGKAGDISITTVTLEVNNGAQLSASTFGKGDAGRVIINATDSIKFDGQGKDSFPSGANSGVARGAEGKAGGISITTNSLELTNGGQLSTGTFGKGDAGSVTINATDSIKFDGGNQNNFFTGVGSQVDSGAEGKAGGISITTNSLELINGARLTATTSSTGKAGSIILNVNENITIAGNGTAISASTLENSTGNGGSIIIDPKVMTIRDGAKISVNSQGEGIGGDVELSADFLTLDNGQITAQTRNNTGGNINLNLKDVLLLRNNSQISTTAGNQQFGGNGGNIDIDSKFIVAIPEEDSDITANAFSGSGGNVTINSQGIFGIEPRTQETNKSDITASSDLGVPGNINLISPDNSSIQDNLTDLPANQIDTNALIANSCIVRSSKRQENSFTITGSGGLRNSPVDGFVSKFSTGDVRNAFQQRNWKKGDAIVEPTGAYRLADGRLILGRVCE